MSIYRKIAFEPAPAKESASGRSGAIQTFLSVPVSNLEQSSSYQSFLSPTKETMVIVSVYGTSIT